MTTPANPDDEGISADLIGWARRNPLKRGLPSDPELSRRVLSAALGVPPERFNSMSDEDIAAALERLRGLADHWEALASQAEIDDLTGALRRGAGIAAIKREVDRTHRHKGTLSLFFIDVDRLKAINDRDGHAAGDRLLVGVVDAIRDRLRSYDLVVRYGGDEFICALSDVDPAQAEQLAQAVRSAVEARTESTVSIGIAALGAKDDVMTLIGRADEQLYQQRAQREAVTRK